MISTAALLLIGALPPSAPQDPIDLGSAVAELLESRCSKCHGPDTDEPKAVRHWPDATDLAATAANPDLISPGDPDDSDLFLSVSFEDMPPPDSEVTPLSTEELALLSSWIEAGAPMPKPVAPEPGGSIGVKSAGAEPPPPPGKQPAAEAGYKRFVTWVSHFHPVIVHFPIALLTAAMLAELLARLFRRQELGIAATYCLVLGTLAALPSAGLGLLLAAEGNRHGVELEWHRWLGVSVAIFSPLVLWVGHRRPGLRLPLLLLAAVLVGVTGHTGGTLSYGAEWLRWPG
jgi:uncharacterized membrane protein/mono/diheme cytochrome c family protein